MAHTISAKKRIRQNETHRARNRWRIRQMRETLKTFHAAIASGDKKAAAESFRACASAIDKTAQDGVIHKNQAARRKSRLNAKLKQLATGS